jgi:hypothetical protein
VLVEVPLVDDPLVSPPEELDVLLAPLVDGTLELVPDELLAIAPLDVEVTAAVLDTAFEDEPVDPTLGDLKQDATVTATHRPRAERAFM